MGKRVKDKVLGKSYDTPEPTPKRTIAERFGYIPVSSKGSEDDEVLKDLYNKAAELPNPKTMKQVFDNIGSLPEAIPESRQGYYRDSKDKFKALTKQIKDKYDKQSKRAEWAQVGEILGQALTQYAAAYQGMRTGVDISSGLKFSPTDWNAKQTLILKKLQQSIDEVESDEKELEREETKEVGRFEKERGRISNAMLRKLFEEIAAGRKDVKSAEDKESKIDKDANKLINKWASEQRNYNNAIQSAVADFKSLEAKKDTMDEEKYESAMVANIEQLAKRAKVDSRPLLKGWESVKELQEADEEFLPDNAPTTMSKWLSNAGNAATEITDPDAILGIKEYVDPKTSVEEKQEIKKYLSSEFGIELP